MVVAAANGVGGDGAPLGGREREPEKGGEGTGRVRGLGGCVASRTGSRATRGSRRWPGGSRRWPRPLGRAPRLASVRPPGRGGRGQGGGGGLGRLEELGFLNDALYAEQVVRHYSAKGYGLRKLRDELYRRGVPRELWDEALDQAPDSAWQIDRFLAAKLRGRAPEEAEKRRLTSALLRRGFAWGDVREAWSRLGAEILEE